MEKYDIIWRNISLRKGIDVNKKFSAFILGAICLIGSSNVMAQDMAVNNTPVMKEETMELKVGSKEAIISGETLQMLAEPTIINNRTLLPLRFVAEKILQAEVVWDNKTKKAVVKNENTTVEVTLNDTVAFVNGEKVILDTPPVIINDSILLPVRFMSEAFGMTVDYKSSDKSITIRARRENKGPIAAFELDKESFTAGQKLTVTDKSYDQDNDRIVNAIWMINDKQYGSADEVQAALNKAKAGTYTVTLQVEDYCGYWSEIASKTVTIKANEAPVITSFSPTKESYAQGEEIDFTYLVENEEWEEIKNIRWTYKQVDEPNYRAVITRPTAFFAKGDYLVTLQMTDAYGNTSAVKQTTVHITDEVRETEFSYKFTKAEPGDTIDNIIGLNYREYKDANLQSRLTNNETIIMSDSPETVSENGILYTSSFQGKGRLILHHGSEFDSSVAADKMLVIVAENTHYEPVTITLSNKVIKGPNPDVMFLGQQVLKEYFNGTKAETLTLAPGEKTYIYTSQDKTWAKGQTISGLMDINTTGQIQLTTAVMNKKDTIYEVGRLKLLDKSIHVRGTFEGTEIHYEVAPQAGEKTKLVIGQDQEEWVSGIDQTTGEPGKNKGNYGVTYKLKITATEDTGIILNPRADIFRGAVKWEGEAATLAPAHGYFMNTNKKAVMLGVVKAGETKTLEYMLPNGSSAPVLIGFIPKSQW